MSRRPTCERGSRKRDAVRGEPGRTGDWWLFGQVNLHLLFSNYPYRQFLSSLPPSDDRFQVNHSFLVMTSSPPDISTLSLASQQRIHDAYDYDGNAASRPPYHFNTTQGLQQSSYNPISSLAPSPLKSKSALRAGLPSVSPPFF